MKKIGILLILMITVLFITAYVYAQHPRFDPAHERMGHHESWGPGEDNPLTPEQKVKFQEFRRKFKQENAQLIGSVLVKRLELQSLWTDPKADPKAIMDKEKELMDLQNQVKDKIVQYKLEARKFLTPEQIMNWKPARGMGFGFGGGRMMGFGPGMGHGSRMGCGRAMQPDHEMGD